jgi:hypothetical protein
MVVDENDDNLEVETWRRINGNSFFDGNVDVSVFLFDCNKRAMRGTGSPMAVGNYSSGGDRPEQKVTRPCATLTLNLPKHVRKGVAQG